MSALAFAGPHVAAADDPTDGEQLFIYEVNRARSNPPAWGAEHDLGSMLDGVSATPPLAVNGDLIASARWHADEMATYNYFAHYSTVSDKHPNEMVRDHGYPLRSSLSNDANNVESLAAGTFYGDSTAIDVIELLIVDQGVDPPGHRYHLLAMLAFYRNFREVGVGHAYNASATYRNYWAFHTGYRDADTPWLTGVVYDDANENGRYDYGEGLSGVTVSVSPGGSTTTNAAGGWSYAASNGSYTVTASGGSYSGTGSGDVTVTGDNVAVDFISGNAEAEVNFGNQTYGGSEDTTTSSGSGCAAAVGSGRNRDAAADWLLATLLGLMLLAGVRRMR